ncbi:MAG: hypothetical protein Q9180_006106 [Flavoplaca navasiana]
MSHSSSKHRSEQADISDKVANAVELTEKSLKKISLLIDAITKKQTPIYWRLMGLMRSSDTDIISFQESLSSLERQFLQDQKDCPDFNLTEPYNHRMSDANADLLRVERNIRRSVVDPLKNSLINGERPHYEILHQQTEILGAEALNLVREIRDCIAALDRAI